MPRDLKTKPVVPTSKRVPEGGAVHGEGTAAMPVDVRTLKISTIRRDERLQHRTVINPDIVVEWAKLMRAGAEFPPITVWWDGEHHWLSDGFHRIAAAERAGRAEIRAEIRQGSFADAEWDSFGANTAHGIRRTRAETESVIRLALQHSNADKLTDVLMSKHLHVPRATVQYWRKKLSCQSWQDSGVRIVTRGDTTYELKTTNLGKRNGQRPRPRRNLRTDLAAMKEKSAQATRGLLIIIEHWVRGLSDPTKCLGAIEQFLWAHRDEFPEPPVPLQPNPVLVREGNSLAARADVG